MLICSRHLFRLGSYSKAICSAPSGWLDCDGSSHIDIDLCQSGCRGRGGITCSSSWQAPARQAVKQAQTGCAHVVGAGAGGGEGLPPLAASGSKPGTCRESGAPLGRTRACSRELICFALMQMGLPTWLQERASRCLKGHPQPREVPCASVFCFWGTADKGCTAMSTSLQLCSCQVSG